MLVQVSRDIYPFCIVLFTFCGVFLLITAILEGDYNTEDYLFMARFPWIINIIQTFRNSIGDLQTPRYGTWIPFKIYDEDGNELDE